MPSSVNQQVGPPVAVALDAVALEAVALAPVAVLLAAATGDFEDVPVFAFAATLEAGGGALVKPVIVRLSGAEVCQFSNRIAGRLRLAAQS